MSSRVNDLCTPPTDRTPYVFTGRARAVAVAALLGLGAASPVVAQTTFDAVEAALSALEAQVGGQATGPAPDLSGPEVVIGLPPPDFLPPVNGANSQVALYEQDYSFLPAQDADLPCEMRASEITAYSDGLAVMRDSFNTKIQSWTGTFSTLQEQNTTIQVERAFSCPADFKDEMTAFQQDVSSVEFRSVIVEAETNLACFQQNLREMKDTIEELGASNDPNDANRQLILSGLLDRSATEDNKLTATLDDIVFAERRRLQFLESVQLFQDNCELLDSN